LIKEKTQEEARGGIRQVCAISISHGAQGPGTRLAMQTAPVFWTFLSSCLSAAVDRGWADALCTHSPSFPASPPGARGDIAVIPYADKKVEVKRGGG
jgi:hypothetical protein